MIRHGSLLKQQHEDNDLLCYDDVPTCRRSSIDDEVDGDVALTY